MGKTGRKPKGFVNKKPFTLASRRSYRLRGCVRHSGIKSTLHYCNDLSTTAIQEEKSTTQQYSDLGTTADTTEVTAIPSSSSLPRVSNNTNETTKPPSDTDYESQCLAIASLCTCASIMIKVISLSLAMVALLLRSPRL